MNNDFAVTGVQGQTDFKLTTGAAKTVAFDAFDYSIRSKQYEVASDQAAQAVPTKDVHTGASFIPVKKSEACTFLAVYDPSETTVANRLKVAQGPIVAIDTDDSIIVAPRVPAVPKDMVIIGYVTVVVKKAAAANTFTFSTDNWNKSNVVCKAGGLSGYPDRPLIPATS